ncbi:acryloyl-CoA reductase [Paenibacillus sp. FSL K6-0108]|uniref:acrylyl-CoA reductase family protein n=1 Tax=Paenibacillus sp. FSL K6-0108 TaxID=2921417 RepID=UPI0032452259
MIKNLNALLVEKNLEDFSVSVKTIPFEQLPTGDVLIKVAYSSINYKDALATNSEGKIVKHYPFVPGIDLSGHVVSSVDSRFHQGQKVIVTGYELGVSHYGGLSEYACVPAEWVVPLPENLTLKEAMIYGTAGFTAALSIKRLEDNGVLPQNGKVLVTGATGGVGGVAVAIFNKKGYDVTASTGKSQAADYLKLIGAREVITRDEVQTGNKPLNKQLWQAAVDPVGGQQLASILSKIMYGGSVAVSGLTGGSNLPTTVLPFILRGVNLLGIDSVYCPQDERIHLWKEMAGEMKPTSLEMLIDREILLHEVPEALSAVLNSKTFGRILVRVS